jgi:hypothetical protein
MLKSKLEKIEGILNVSPNWRGKLLIEGLVKIRVSLTYYTRKYMHAETLALLTKSLYFPNI